MTKIIECPLCGSENSISDSHCHKCGFEINIQEQSTKKSSDWLNDLRTTSDRHQNMDTNDHSIDDNLNVKDNETDSSDWLNRIRDRKEIDDEFSKFTEQINQQIEIRNEPDHTKDFIESFRDQTDTNQGLNAESSEIISNFRDQNLDNFFEASLDSEEQHPESKSDIYEEKNGQKDWLHRLPKSDEIIETDDNNVQIPGWIQNSNILQSNENLLDSENKSEEIPDWISKFDSFNIEEEEAVEPAVIPDWIQFSGPEDSESNELENEKEEVIPDWIAPEISSTSGDLPSDETRNTVEASISTEIIEPEKENYPPGYQNYETEDLFSDQTNPFQETAEEGYDFNNFSLSDLPTTPQSTNDKDLVSQKKIYTEIPPFDDHLDQNSIPEWEDDFELVDNDPASVKDENNIVPFIKDDLEISPGELPAWIKAMRPIEAFTPNINLLENRKRIEKSGPLTGLRGVLSSEDVVKSYSTPPSYSVKLNLSEKQKINAELLSQIFSPEQQPEKKYIQTSKNREIIFRLLISLLLLLTIIFSIFKEIPASSLPDLFPAETVRFVSISNGLLLSQETSPHILIIMDNEAASQAEINLMTQSVFERLMMKDSYLSIISSNPNANLVATEILYRANLAVPTFLGEGRISNFGFLPGNTIGIQNFLLDPRRSVPVGIFSDDIWNSPGLKDIYQISQFDSVLLVTDNPENSKLWLEQIRLHIPEMPILVAATAQASPLLQPYVDSNQIDGMLSGLYGSITYSQLIQKESETLTSYWNSYKLGIFAFILIIVIGGLYSVINQIFKMSKTKTR